MQSIGNFLGALSNLELCFSYGQNVSLGFTGRTFTNQWIERLLLRW